MHVIVDVQQFRVVVVHVVVVFYRGLHFYAIQKKSVFSFKYACMYFFFIIALVNATCLWKSRVKWVGSFQGIHLHMRVEK